MKTGLLTFLLGLVASVGFTQSRQNIDSLRHQLALTRQDTNRVLLLVQLANTSRFYQPDSATKLAQQAIYLAQKLNFSKGVTGALNIIGEMQRIRGDLPQSLETHFNALRISRTSRNQEGVANSLAFIGFVYLGMNEYRQGLGYLHQVRKIYERLPLTSVNVVTVSSIGNTYERMNRLDSALYFQQRAYVLWRKLPRRDLGKGPVGALILTRLGIVEARLGNPNRALAYYQDALRTTYLTGDLINRSRIQYRIAQLYHQRQQPDSSLHYAQMAFINSQRVSQMTIVLDASSLLVNLYQAQHKIDSAFHYQQVAIAAKDSLFGPVKFQRLQLLTLTEQQRQEQLREEQDRQQARFQRIGLLSALGVFLMIALILWRANRQQQRANQSLNQKNNQIEAQRNTLEKTLTELKITQTQLIQKEKMASLGELTSGIAHEIQNPLNFVNNFSEVSTELVGELKEELDLDNTDEAKAIADDLTQNLQKITQHGGRASAIVRGMLEHSRTETGEKRPTDLNALADEYLRIAYQGLRAKDKTGFTCELVTDFEPTLEPVDVAPQEIGRVLLNLYNNAFYAVSERTKSAPVVYQPTVQVRTQQIGHSVEIRVSDNGTGIPDAVKAKIFQPFFTTKPTGEGTGLGLSLSYDIVTKGHGGTLEVETVAGEFTEFIIQLPV